MIGFRPARADTVGLQRVARGKLREAGQPSDNTAQVDLEDDRHGVIDSAAPIGLKASGQQALAFYRSWVHTGQSRIGVADAQISKPRALTELRTHSYLHLGTRDLPGSNDGRSAPRGAR